jgi:hypothetical protein
MSFSCERLVAILSSRCTALVVLLLPASHVHTTSKEQKNDMEDRSPPRTRRTGSDHNGASIP